MPFALVCAGVIRRWGVNSPTFANQPTTILCNPDGLVSNAQTAQYSHCLKGEQLLAVSDGQGFVSMIDTSEALPCGLDFQESQANNLKAQWRAHELAVTELHWIKVNHCRRQFLCFYLPVIEWMWFAGRYADDHWISRLHHQAVGYIASREHRLPAWHNQCHKMHSRPPHMQRCSCVRFAFQALHCQNFCIPGVVRDRAGWRTLLYTVKSCGKPCHPFFGKSSNLSTTVRKF